MTKTVMLPPMAPEMEAEIYLATMAKDPRAVRRYAALAERQGWPCYGMTWSEWAAERADDHPALGGRGVPCTGG